MSEKTFDRLLMLGVVIAAALILLMARNGFGADKKPIALYNHTGRIVTYFDPGDPEDNKWAFALDDHTMVEETLSFDSLEEPLQKLRKSDSHPEDLTDGPDGFKFRIVGTFKYREQILPGQDPAICVSVPLKAHQPPEACYAAYPRYPSVLDLVAHKGTNENSNA